MTRGEQYGLGLAVAGHVALFALLSLAWSNAPKPPPTEKPIEVSLVDDVALDQHAPKAPEPPAQSTAPDPGPPDDAPPPPKVEEVDPVPTPPKPEPVPPKPTPPKPKPVPATPPKPAPPKPKPDAVPPPKPVPKPAPKKPVAEAAAKPTKPSPAKAAPAKAAPAKSAAPTNSVAATKATGTGRNPKATKPRATGSLLDDDFRKGLTQSPSKSKAHDAAPGATMNAAAAADIGSAIKRQVQPCADRQVNPGPGASRIVVTIRLSLNRDGTLAGRPTVSDEHGGVDDENRRYVDAVDRNAVATFAGCAPLRGLPPELYDVPRGWKTFILRYKLPG